MNEVLFVDEEPTENGLIARALGEPIFAGTDGMANLHRQVRDAAHSHFDQDRPPHKIILC